jgi:hypothetical protein
VTKETRTVEIAKYSTQQWVDKGALQDAKLNIIEDFTVPYLVVQLEVELLKDTHDRLEQQITFKWPATWWDHLKLRLGWSWLGEVHYQKSTKRVGWEASSIFPEAKIYPREWGRRVKYVTFSEGEQFDET